MRAVIDTNVLLSGLLWHGAPHVLLAHVRAFRLGLVSSPALLTELEIVISRPKFEAILTRSSTSREHALAVPVCRDPEDDAVLALALAAQVDLIVSGDYDLLALTPYQGIPIVTAGQAIEQIGDR